jgi:hypothetical protein
MTAFEVMDPKMDLRLRRKDFLHPSKAISTGLLITERELTLQETLAILNEFFREIATWQ